MADKMPEGIKTVMYWVLGCGVLALIGLVMLILFGNLSGNVGFGQDSTTVTNLTFTFTVVATNITDISAMVNPTLTNVVVTNATNATDIVSSTNYTNSNGYITADATSAYVDEAVNISATLSYDEQGKIDTQNLINNYTQSVTNTGKQLPVVGTIVGIALLLVILIGILIFAIKKLMGVTSGESSGSKDSYKFAGSSNADFG